MSTVLWANVLRDGKVTSEEADYYALYKHSKKLEALGKTLKLPSFLALCDTTDLRYNLEDLPLPEGMQSTDEWMAKHGNWLPLSQALAMLQQLREHIASRQIRFGLFSNAQSEVLAELDQAIAFAASHAGSAQQFNFSVVM